MLGFFRRFTKSKLGAVLAIAVLAIIAVSFAAGDITGVGGGLGGGANARTVAEVGGEPVPEPELVTQTRNALRAIQQEQPTADMAGLIGANGVERILEQLIERRAFEQFGRAQGLVVSDRAIDGVIASIPAFRGADGKFSQTAYEAALAQQRVSSREVRGDLARERIIQFLTAPVNGGAKVGQQFALPYAALLLERREGAIATIPAAALGDGAAPTDAELQAFYRTNLARYTVPERRVIRYALVTPDSIRARATPTEADFQSAYRADPRRFAARQQRDVQTVTLLDQGAANALAQRVRAGQPLDAAARAAGLEARTLTGQDRAALAAATSTPVADALFGAPQDAVVGPVRAGGGGFTVGRVTRIVDLPARTLDQARAELTAEVTQAKVVAELGRLNDALDTAASEGASFDELVRDQKLTAAHTPGVTSAGIDPLAPAAPDPRLAGVIQAGFAADQGDAPTIVPVGTDGGFALVSLDTVASAAPRPLVAVRAQVAQASRAQRALAAARGVATRVAAAVDRGTPLAAALQQTGLRLPAPRPVSGPRAALAQANGQVAPALALMFAMAPRRAKLAPAADGWTIVYLDRIIAGDATRDPRTLQAARADLDRVVGRELADQFGRAVRDSLGVTRNAAGIARAKAELSGQASGAAN